MSTRWLLFLVMSNIPKMGHLPTPDSEAPNMGVAKKGGHPEQIKLVGAIPTPLKNDGLRQLWWWNSQLNGKIKFMFQTSNQKGFSVPPYIQICIGAVPSHICFHLWNLHVVWQRFIQFSEMCLGLSRILVWITAPLVKMLPYSLVNRILPLVFSVR